MPDFDAARARAKRPCPIWVDAFQRDTQHLEADEVGAYFLILMAMWTRPECDFPDDDVRLARISRVSVRLWKSRIGPTLRPFFGTEKGALISKRLREEATYTERQCKSQSDRKSGEKSGNSLKNNNVASTADKSMDITTGVSPEQPTQLPNISSSSGSVVARARDRDPPPPISPDPKPPDRLPIHQPQAQAIPADDSESWALFRAVVKACGLAEDRLPTHWMPPSGVMLVQRWIGLGLSEQEIIDTARMTRANFTDPPASPKALEGAMQRTAVAKQLPPLAIPADQRPKPTGGPNVPSPAAAERQARRADLIRAAARGTT